jgi:GNAT superfamily N-acetyltransferase
MDEITIRDFRPGDAETCFRIRADGFIQSLGEYLGPPATAACVNAYMPSEFLRMSDTMEWFVAEQNDETVGFCTVEYLNDSTAELLFLYVALDRHGSGVGSQLIRHAENWLREHRPEVGEFVLDTVVPEYNQAFYEKMGFAAIRERGIVRNETAIKATQMGKTLHPEPGD